MPYDHVFSAGSLAKTYLEVAEWYGKQTDSMNAKYICQPFMGFGRMASAMLRDGVTIDSCDFQRLSWAIATGVFNAKEAETNVDKPHYRKGKAYNGGLVRYIDERSAGFVDWVVDEGTPLDVACLGMSIPSQTFHGYISSWTGSFDKFYAKFERVRAQCAEYIPMPGTFNFVEGDFFKLPQYWENHYDALILDPPRLLSIRDQYSRGVWPRVNNVLGGSVKIGVWSDKNYFQLLRRIAEIKSDYLLMSWSIGKPDLNEIKAFITDLGELEEEVVWETHSNTIYGWRVNRQNKGDA